MKKLFLLSTIALFAVITATAQDKPKKLDPPTNKFEILRQQAANATEGQGAVNKAVDSMAFPANDKFELLRQQFNAMENQKAIENKADNAIGMPLNIDDKLEIVKNRTVKAKNNQRATKNNTTRKVVVKPHLRNEGDTTKVVKHNPKP